MPESRLPLLKVLAERLGLEGLAEVEASLVRTRSVPPRLIARLYRNDDTILTPRQREVMVLLTTGLSRQEIADELGITLNTVKHHLRGSYLRLGVANQVQAVNAFIDEQA